MHANDDSLEFKLPPRFARRWQKVLDTNVAALCEPLEEIEPDAAIVVVGRSVVALRHIE